MGACQKNSFRMYFKTAPCPWKVANLDHQKEAKEARLLHILVACQKERYENSMFRQPDDVVSSHSSLRSVNAMLYHIMTSIVFASRWDQTTSFLVWLFTNSIFAPVFWFDFWKAFGREWREFPVIWGRFLPLVAAEKMAAEAASLQVEPVTNVQDLCATEFTSHEPQEHYTASPIGDITRTASQKSKINFSSLGWKQILKTSI